MRTKIDDKIYRLKEFEEAEIEARAIEKTDDYLRSCGDTTSKYL